MRGVGRRQVDYSSQLGEPASTVGKLPEPVQQVVSILHDDSAKEFLDEIVDSFVRHLIVKSIICLWSTPCKPAQNEKSDLVRLLKGALFACFSLSNQ